MRCSITFSCPDQTCFHELCEGNLTLTMFVPPYDEITVPRIQHGIRRTRAEMILSMNTQLHEQYILEDSVIIRSIGKYVAQAANAVRVLEVHEQPLIRAPFKVLNYIQQGNRLQIDHLMDAIALADRTFFESLGVSPDDLNNFSYRPSHNDPMKIQNDPLNRHVMSLRELAYRKLSFVHYVYGTFGGLYYWVYTNESVPADTSYRLFNENSLDNTRRGLEHMHLMSLMPDALNLLFDFIGTRQFFKKFTFDYNPVQLMSDLKLNASSGIQPGLSQVLDRGDQTYKMTTSGHKLLHLAAAIKQHKAWVKSTLQDHVKIPLDNFNVIKVKTERRMAYCGSTKELEKILIKKRTFFIPNIVHSIHETWLHKKRMMIERGNMINIGRVWWYGGADQFANYLRYDFVGMEWSEGDYSSHDKHIQDWLITTYLSTNALYYDIDNMSPDEVYLFYRAHAESIFNVVVKPTCHVTMEGDELWSIINGVLYSGGPITSPGGSFITGLMWCLFLCDVMEKHPRLKKKILKAIEAGLIRIVLYSDDHLSVYPAIYSYLLNEHQFAKFSFVYFGCVIKDILIHSKFLSVPSELGGFIGSPGPKFLKRYFIKSNNPLTAAVLPYKPAHETITRLYAPKSTSWIDYFLSSIGQAWDTMFTNPVAYKACHSFFQALITYVPDQYAQDVLKGDYRFLALADEQIRYQITRSTCVSETDLYLGFPAYTEGVSRHKLDLHKLDYSRSFYERETLNLTTVVGL